VDEDAIQWASLEEIRLRDYDRPGSASVGTIAAAHTFLRKDRQE